MTAGQGSALPPVAPSLADPIAGPPYQIEGKWYVPTHEPRYDEIGIASWYGPTFSGKVAASGEVFDEYAMTAAHPTLPIPSMVEVTNLANNRSVTVRVNDRGPFIDDRIIDLSRAAAQALGLVEPGTGRVRVRYLGAAPAEANTILAMNGPQAGPLDGQLISDSAVRSASLPPRSPTPADPNPAGEPFVPAAVREYADLAGFYVQAGSFADLGNAHALKSDLQSIGPAFITTAMVNGTEFFRVMLGPWPTREDALMTLSRLQVAGGAAIIVSRPPR
jgi:rare lipoprotein A